jgi:hypothetical protein
MYVKIIELNNNDIITTHYQMEALYVDDLLIAGSKNLATKLESVLKQNKK